MQLISIALHILHITIIIVNLTGWMFKPLRRFHLLVAGITLFSWIGMGWFYGFGYCFITDYHYDVLYKLGVTDLPASYVKYILDLITGLSWNPMLVDFLTGISFTIAILCSLYVNRDLFKRGKSRPVREQ